VTRKRASAFLAAALAMAALGRLARLPLGTAAFAPLTLAWRMPVDTLDFVRLHRLEGDTFAYFLWGGYVEYRVAGALRVFVDPRSETVFPAEVYARYLRTAQMRPGWIADLRSSGARYVLWPTYSSEGRAFIAGLQASGEWRTLYRDAVSMLLERRDAERPYVLVATPESPYRLWSQGRLELEAGQLEAARRHLAKSLSLMPNLRPACEDLSRTLDRLGDPASATDNRRRCRSILS